MSPLMRWLWILAATAFVASILWSMWFETLLPLMRQGNWVSFWLHVVGMPIILAGSGFFVVGGVVALRGFGIFMSSEQYGPSRAGAKLPRAMDRSARLAGLAAVGRMLRPAMPWLGAGAILLVAGSVIINL